MKRTCNFIMIFSILISAIFLSACGDSYNSMKMNIIDESEINLIIDSDFTDEEIANYTYATVQVVISGVSSDVSKMVSFSSQPAEIISPISNVLDGNVSTLTFMALMPGSGELIIKSYEGGLELSIPITVETKIKSINSKTTEIAYEIPDEDSIEYQIDRNTFDILPTGASEVLKYEVIDSLPTGVALSEDSTSLLVSSEAVEGSTFTLRPYTDKLTSENAYVEVVLYQVYENIELFAYTSVVDGTSSSDIFFNLDEENSLSLISNVSTYNEISLSTRINNLDGTYSAFDIEEFVGSLVAYRTSIATGETEETTVVDIVKDTSNNYSFIIHTYASITDATLYNYFMEFNLDRINFMGEFTQTIVFPFEIITAPTVVGITANNKDIELDENDSTIITLYDYYTEGDLRLNVKLYGEDLVTSNYSYVIYIDSFYLSVYGDSSTKNGNVLILKTDEGEIEFSKTSSSSSIYVSQPLSHNSNIYVTYVQTGGTSTDNPYFEIYSIPNTSLGDKYTTLYKLDSAYARIEFLVERGVYSMFLSGVTDDYMLIKGNYSSTPLLLALFDKDDNSISVDSAGDIVFSIYNYDGTTANDGLQFSDKFGVVTESTSQSIIFVENSIYLYAKTAGSYMIEIIASNGVTISVSISVNYIYSGGESLVSNYIINTGSITSYDGSHIEMVSNTSLTFNETLYDSSNNIIDEENSVVYEIYDGDVVEYLSDAPADFVAASSSNIATISGSSITFKNPTYVDTTDGDFVLGYITLVIKVYGDILNGYVIEEGLLMQKIYYISVYVPVETLQISSSSAVVKSSSSLGVYNQEESQLLLSLTVYPANALLGITATDDYYVYWSNQVVGKYTYEVRDGDAKIVNWTFDIPENENSYVVNLMAYVYAYEGKTVTNYQNSTAKVFATFSVAVNEAVQSTGISFSNTFETNSDGNKLVYLQEDDGINNSSTSVEDYQNTYQILAKVTNINEVFDDSLLYYLVSTDGTPTNQIAYFYQGTTSIVPVSAGDLTLVIIASDSMHTAYEPTMNNLANIASYCTNYELIDIVIANGTEENPYYISDETDLQSIANNTKGLSSYYVVINDIFINYNTYTPIGNIANPFVGTIRSQSGFCFTIYKTAVTYNSTGIFDVIGALGTVYDLNFVVYIGSITNQDTGAIANENFGTIYNCQVHIELDLTQSESSIINLSKSNSTNINYSIGGMVGVNWGKIILTDETKIGVSGNINIGDNYFINVGGVAGINYSGMIYGAYFITEDKYIDDYSESIIALIGDIGSISNVNIYAISADYVGGVVGFNYTGMIYGVYSNSNVVANDYVGGIIGYNNGYNFGSYLLDDTTDGVISGTISSQTADAENYTKYNDDGTALLYQVIDSFSSGSLEGNFNVGGVTGYDVSGKYFYVNSEFYYENTTETDSEYKDTTINITGSNFVGGMIGYSSYSYLMYCYASSYKYELDYYSYDYSNYDADIQLVQSEDVISERDSADRISYVGGLIGYGLATEIIRSMTNIKIKLVYIDTDYDIYAAGLAGYINNGDNAAFIYEVYTKGQIYTEHNDATLTTAALIYAGAASAYYSYIDMGSLSILGIASFDKDDSVYSKNDLVSLDTLLDYERIYGDARLDNTVGFSLDSNINSGDPYLINPYALLYEESSLALDMNSTITVELLDSLYDSTSSNTDVDINNKYFIVDKDGEDLLTMLYTDLLSQVDTVTNDYITEDEESINTFNIYDMFKITVSNVNVRPLRLQILSSDSSILEVDGESLIVKGTGTVNLYFYNNYNHESNSTITINVINYVSDLLAYTGQDYSADTQLSNNTMSMKVGTSKSVFTTTYSTVSINGREYTYRQNTDLTVQFNAVSTLQISSNANKIVDIHSFSLNYSSTEKDYDDIAVEIYMLIEDSIVGYVYFLVSPYVGTERIETSFDELSIGTQVQTTLSVIMYTDYSIDDFELSIFGYDTIIEFDNSGVMYSINEDISFPFIISKTSFVYDETNSTKTFELKIVTSSEYYAIKETQNWILQLKSTSNDLISSELIYIELNPQDISSITVENFAGIETYSDIGTYSYEETRTDKIVPNTYSIIRINVYPSYSDFDYLTITSDSASGVFSFKQVLLTPAENYTSYPYEDTSLQETLIDDGIKLYKWYYAEDGEGNYYQSKTGTNADIVGQFYVRLSVAGENVTNGDILDIKVSAYKNGNSTTIMTKSISLQAQETPSINISIDSLDFDMTSADQMTSGVNLYVPYGETIEINYQAYNTDIDAEIVSSINAKNFDIYLDTTSFTNKNMIYYSSKIDSSLYNQDFTFTIQVTTVINGYEYVSSIMLNFIVQKIIIKSISFTNVNNDVLSNRYDQMVEFSAYFATTDLWYNKNVVTDIELLAFSTSIYNYVNSSTYLEYLWSATTSSTNFNLTNGANYDSDSYVFTIETNSEHLYIGAENIVANNYSISINFNVLYDTDGLPKISFGSYEGSVSNSFELDFYIPEYAQSAIPIYTENEFNNMEVDRKYILMNDITLTDFSPITTDISSFDGNSYTISISNYDFSDIYEEDGTIESLNLALFETIESDCIISNIILYIPETSIDITGVYAFNYAGIAVTNYGMITNCSVIASTVDSASLTTTQNMSSSLYTSISSLIRNRNANYIYSSTATADQVVDVAGLVHTNSASGYISNCKVIHSIVASGNIAGIAIENAGTIVSTKFELGFLQNEKAEGVNDNIAGFVLTNNGDISLSYSAGGYSGIGYTEDQNYLRSDMGGIDSRSDAAGFVFTNSGTITDCYSDLDMSSQNKVAGFVFNNNSGVIETCYTTSNMNTDDINCLPFIGADDHGNVNNDSGEIIDCYYLFDNTQIDNSQIATALYANTTVNNNLTSYNQYVNTLGINTSYITDDSDYSYYQTTLGFDSTIIASFSNQPSFINFAFSYGDADNGQWSFSRIDSTKDYYRPTLNSADYIYITTMELDENNPTDLDDSGELIYNFVSAYNYNGLGSDYNPYLIYDTYSYETLLTINSSSETITGSYKLISDINFDNFSSNPITTTMNFSGKLDGNNMSIFNFKIFANSTNIDSIGLFDTVSNANGYVKNLTLSPKVVTATNVTYVGTLAGKLESGNISNITIDASNVVITAKNIAGGVIGKAEGMFSVNNITSNISVYTTYRNTVSSTYNTYNRYYFNNEIITNETTISYSGGLIGIADYYVYGYENINDVSLSRTLAVSLLKIDERVVVSGENAGYALGLIGESTQVQKVEIAIQSNSSATGLYVVGGVAAENRGIILDSYVTYTKDILTQIYDQNQLVDGIVNIDLTIIPDINLSAFTSSRVAGGIVGFNNGGIVSQVANTVAVISIASISAGGIIGVMVGGELSDSYTSSSVFATRHIGGAVGIIRDYAGITDIGLSTTSMSGVYNTNNADSFSESFSISNVVANNLWELRYTSEVRNLDYLDDTESVYNTQFYRVIGGIVGAIKQSNNNDVDSSVFGNWGTYNNILYYQGYLDLYTCNIMAYHSVDIYNIEIAVMITDDSTFSTVNKDWNVSYLLS